MKTVIWMSKDGDVTIEFDRGPFTSIVTDASWYSLADLFKEIQERGGKPKLVIKCDEQ